MRAALVVEKREGRKNPTREMERTREKRTRARGRKKVAEVERGRGREEGRKRLRRRNGGQTRALKHTPPAAAGLRAFAARAETRLGQRCVVHCETDWLVGSVTRYRDSDKKDGTTNQLFLGLCPPERRDANAKLSELKIPRHRVRRHRRRL